MQFGGQPKHRGTFVIIRQRLATFARLDYLRAMSKKNERGAGAMRWEFSPWAPMLALLPYRIGTKAVAAGTGFDGGDIAAKVELGKPVPITRDDADEVERKRVYEALLEFPWLSIEVRCAVLKALGRSYSIEDENYKQGRAAMLRHRIDEAIACMKENGEHPRGGRAEAARAAVAKSIGMKVETLKKFLQRH
jgi:hypothetical protein